MKKMVINEEEYLAHYGVLGMRWGRRKAVRETASVASAKAKAKAANKQYSKDYNKASALGFDTIVGTKGSKKRWDAAYKSAREAGNADKAYRKAKTDAMYKELNKKYPGNSKALNKRLAKTSTGKAVAQTFLLGSYGALKYNEARVNGTSKGKAIGKAILKNWGNNLTLGAMARKDKKKAEGRQ